MSNGLTMYKVINALDPILRNISPEIEIVNAEIQDILDNMLKTMYEESGIGLAAPQIGINKRIFILDLGDNDEIERPKDFYPLFIVNPNILEKSENLVERVEGCLSIPGIRVKVKRPEWIRASYIDYNNNKQVIEAKGWLARAFLHELDHLNGVLAIDYASPLQKAVLLEKMKKFISKKSKI
jgi:peptide deformylase